MVLCQSYVTAISFAMNTPALTNSNLIGNGKLLQARSCTLVCGKVQSQSPSGKNKGVLDGLCGELIHPEGCVMNTFVKKTVIVMRKIAHLNDPVTEWYSIQGNHWYIINIGGATAYRQR